MEYRAKMLKITTSMFLGQGKEKNIFILKYYQDLQKDIIAFYDPRAAKTSPSADAANEHII